MENPNEFDFEIVGKQCHESNCRQRDFLPFRCNHCLNFYCKEHFHYQSHTCTAHYKRDLTKGVDINSVECPLCKKSIKYDRNLTPDEKARESYISNLWETHFLTDCSHEPPAAAGSTSSSRRHCGSAGCRTILGPSNSFNCPKCHIIVCLAHRVPEDHKCIDTIRSQRLNQLSTTVAASSQGGHRSHILNSSNKTKTQSVKAKKNTSTSHQVQYSNTLKGSAERRKQRDLSSDTSSVNNRSEHSLLPLPPPLSSNVAVSTTAPISCPFCEFSNSNSKEMEEHVNIFHLQIFESASVTSTQSTGTRSDPVLAEECPQCKQRFPDAIALVNHVELRHREPVTTGGRDCSLS